MSTHTLRIVGIILAGLLVVVLGVRFAFSRMLSSGGAPANALQQIAHSKDGTRIAYEQTGAGPVVILVSAALADREGNRRLAKELSSSFTVINYDRRGRGRSSNTEPYAVEREIEDIEALVNAAGVPVFLFGSSSGSVLALDAGSRLGAKVKRLFLYEPPFIVDGTHAPIPDTLHDQIRDLLAANKRNEAVSVFFGKAIGIPPVGVAFMRLFMPTWSDMTRIAHTAPYDLMILVGTQSGKPLPAGRWSPATSSTMVAVGARSETFFHNGAKALCTVLSVAEYRSLPGLDHSAVLMAPKPLAGAVREFFANANWGSKPSS